MEQTTCNMLCCWFVGVSTDAAERAQWAYRRMWRSTGMGAP